jgi:multisite-specific tRNA:(cytosine-C5)-methyltransferase
MVLPLWRSLFSINLMLPKEDRKAMLLRLYNDTTPLIDNSGKNQRNKIDDVAQELEEQKKEAEADIDRDSSPAAIDEEMPDRDNAIDNDDAENDKQ